MKAPCADCQIYGCPDDGPDFDRVRRHCDCHGRVRATEPHDAPGLHCWCGAVHVDRHRRTEGGDRFSHNTVAVLEAFATSVIMLHASIRRGIDQNDPWYDEAAYRDARSAVRAARMLTVRDEYR